VPSYDFEILKTGEIEEISMTIAEMEKCKRKDGTSVLPDGRRAQQLVLACPVGHTPGAWPMKSVGLGVTPDQVKQAEKEYAEHGVPTSFTPDGRAILRDRGHRNAVLRARGYHDKDGGYGDVT